MRKSLITTLAAGAVALGMGMSNAASVTAPIVVTPSTSELVGFQQTRFNCEGETEPMTGSQGQVAVGPLAPIGIGAYEMTVGPISGSVERLSQSLFGGAELASIDLRYSTWVLDGERAPVMTLDVDRNGDAAADSRLVFDPALQSEQGPVGAGTWQHWNAAEGAWYEQGAGPGLFGLDSVRGKVVNTTTAAGRTLGGIGIEIGCGEDWSGFVGYVDAITVAATRLPLVADPAMAGVTFNFELGVNEIDG